MSDYSAYDAMPTLVRQLDDKQLLKGVLAAFDFKIQNYADQVEQLADYIKTHSLWKDADLDWIASLTPWRNRWDSSLPYSIKRNLLSNTAFIFNNKGRITLLSDLFIWFEVPEAKLKALSGFVLGTSLLGTGTLGNNPFNYRIEVPVYYGDGTLERARINFIIKEFASFYNLSIVTV